MLARIFKTATSRFTEQPKPENTNLTNLNDSGKSLRSRRSEATEEELTDENSINVYVSTSNLRSERDLGEKSMAETSDDEVFVTPMTSRKRKVLPVREKEIDTPTISKRRIVVEIPAMKTLPLNSKPEPTPKILEIPSSDNDDEKLSDQETPKKPITPRKAASVKKANNTKKGDTPRKVETPKKSDKTTTTHRRFGSEEPQEIFSTAPEPTSSQQAIVISDSESEEESDDDAPEAIGIQDAAVTLKQKEKEALQAVKEQEATIRKKRKERNETLKQQAQSSKKRKVFEEETPAHAPESDNSADERESTKPTKRIRLDHSSLPDLLPAEYLEDTPEDVTLPSIESQIVKSKKTKFSDIAEKKIKDKKKGSTTYRVVKEKASILAPKSSDKARSMKESWLQGRSAKGVVAKRKSVSSGFLRR